MKNKKQIVKLLCDKKADNRIKRLELCSELAQLLAVERQITRAVLTQALSKKDCDFLIDTIDCAVKDTGIFHEFFNSASMQINKLSRIN